MSSVSLLKTTAEHKERLIEGGNGKISTMFWSNCLGRDKLIIVADMNVVFRKSSKGAFSDQLFN